jgi:hypothetical protein
MIITNVMIIVGSRWDCSDHAGWVGQIGTIDTTATTGKPPCSFVCAGGDTAGSDAVRGCPGSEGGVKFITTNHTNHHQFLVTILVLA